MEEMLCSVLHVDLDIKGYRVPSKRKCLDARKIYNQQKRVGEFDNSKNSFLEGHCRAFTPHIFLVVLKMFCNF